MALLFACLIVTFSAGLDYMVTRWSEPHYVHGYLVPVVSLLLLACSSRELASRDVAGSWWGAVWLLAGLGLQVLGSMSAVYEVAEYGFVMALWGLALAATGWRGVRLLWAPLVFLLWMVPLAYFVDRRVFGSLLALSGHVGEAVLRSVGYSALAEGNGIDLGSVVLPLASSSTGTGFLLPLLCLASLIAILWRGRWWQRAALLLAAVPVTILLDGLRIAAFGVALGSLGLQRAQSLLGEMASTGLVLLCLALLVLLAWLLARLQGQPLKQLLAAPVPDIPAVRALLGRVRLNGPVLAATALLVGAAGISTLYTPPPALVPERESLASLPMQIGDWQGAPEFVDRDSLATLQLTDYSMTTYNRWPAEQPVTLWIAYYAAQVQGMAVHSPQACLPGSGWQIESIEQRSIPGGAADGAALPVNRVVISQGGERQLVYYWFAQRGRTITNEFLVKWFIFQDGLTRNRTDGALVRITTPVLDAQRIGEADARLVAFVQAAASRLVPFLPGADAPAGVK